MFQSIERKTTHYYCAWSVSSFLWRKSHIKKQQDLVSLNTKFCCFYINANIYSIDYWCVIAFQGKLFYLQLSNTLSPNNILILNHKRLMTTSALFINLNNQLFPIRNSKFWHCENSSFSTVAGYFSHIIVRTNRKYNLFLYCSTFRNFFIYDFKCDIITIKSSCCLFCFLSL